jgi:hypothetical protein
MCGSNAPRGDGALRPGLSPGFGKLTWGALLESPSESQLWFAIRRMNGVVRWGRFRLYRCSNGSRIEVQRGHSRTIATDSITSVGASRHGLRDGEAHGLALGRTFVLVFVILLSLASRSQAPHLRSNLEQFVETRFILGESGRVPSGRPSRTGYKRLVFARSDHDTPQFALVHHHTSLFNELLVASPP